ncbi:hypothetical protein, conserved [Trypanosoma vivax Y486]|uniref:Uncharacterized protein n=1 Tax=Trypanosoma vivax (strain Y486) TaxID=1055687 RepID=F9WRN7_TRYVY|nr:hypothetical protein, conserved [Trypanosoma vivax Y486]|eukprot:CCD20221.1 hypothetical protein, conserved [Trypanosoma vivax Y486]
MRIVDGGRCSVLPVLPSPHCARHLHERVQRRSHPPEPRPTWPQLILDAVPDTARHDAFHQLAQRARESERPKGRHAVRCLFRFSSGTMMPCRYLAGTCPVRKLQLNSRSTRFIDTLPSCFGSSQRVSSSPGAVLEYSSCSTTPNSASLMGRNVLRLVLGIFIAGACGAFVGLAMRLLANVCACWRLLSGWPSTASTGDVSGRGAYIDFARFQLAEPVADSFDTFAFHRPSAVSASTFLRQRISASRFRSFLHSWTISYSSGVQNAGATSLPLGIALFAAIQMPLVTASFSASALLADLFIPRNIYSALSFLNSFHLALFRVCISRACLEGAIVPVPAPTNVSSVIQ